MGDITGTLWQQVMSNNYKYCLSNSGVQTSESTLKMWDFVLLKYENDCGKWKLLLCYDVKLMRNICRSSKLVTESICTDSQILASSFKHKKLFVGDALSCWRTWSSSWTQKFKRSLETCVNFLEKLLSWSCAMTNCIKLQKNWK